MLSPTAESTAGKTGQQHNNMLLRGKGDHVMTCLQPSKASWLCNSHPGCLTGGILSPTDKPEAVNAVVAIVGKSLPTQPASVIDFLAFCMTFFPGEPLPLTLFATGEGCRPFLAPWTTMGRALRPEPDKDCDW